MEDHAPETKAPETQTSRTSQTPETEVFRSPISPRDIVRQIYLISAVVIVLLSLAIWLMIALS